MHFLSLEHLLYFCKFSKKLWDDLYAWLSLKYVIPDFDFKTVKYLSFCRNCDVEFLINNIVILDNYFIHKCKFFNNPPTLVLFQQDLMIFFKSNQIKSNQITFIVTSPQHKCLGEWNSYERAPDSAKKTTTTAIYIWTDSAKKQQQFTYGQYIFTDCTEDNVQNTHTCTQYA